MSTEKPLQFKEITGILPRRFGINLRAQVIQAQVSEQTAQNGEKYRACDGLLGDATGTISFRSTGDFAKLMADNLNKIVIIKNTSARLYKRFIKINLIRNSTVEIADKSEPDFKVNDSNNVSEKELPRLPSNRPSPYRKKEDIERERQERENRILEVRRLRPRSRGVPNIRVKILKIESTEPFKAKDETEIKQVRGVCGDATGVINFRITGEQADLIQKDQVYTFRQINSNVFQQTLQVTLKKDGVVTLESETIDSVDEQNNLSEKVYQKTQRSENRRQRSRDENDKPYQGVIRLVDLIPRKNGATLKLKVIDSTSDTITTRKGDQIKQVKGVLGDSTAVINFRVARENADLIEKNKVYTFTNVKSAVYKGRHQIELDKSGKITEEKENIGNVNQTKNLSEVEIPQRERRVREERRDERNSGERRRKNSTRGTSSQRKDSRDENRREKSSRRKYSNDGDRRRSQSNSRRNNNNNRDRDYDRDDRRNNNTRRERDSERASRQPRPPRQRTPEPPREAEEEFTKLTNLRPGFHGANLVLRVTSAEFSENTARDRNIPVCKGVAGDETGVIQFRFTHDLALALRNGKDRVFSFQNCKSNVFKGFHDLGGDKYTTIKEVNTRISKTNDANDLSSIEYEKQVIAPSSPRNSDAGQRRGGRNFRKEKRRDDDYNRDSRNRENNNYRGGENRNRNRNNERSDRGNRY